MWNISGLCCECKQKEIADLPACNSIDIVAAQESWEKEDSKIDVHGYKWPRTSQRSQRGVSEVEVITMVVYEQHVWMKVRGEKGKVGPVYRLCIHAY